MLSLMLRSVFTINCRFSAIGQQNAGVIAIPARISPQPPLQEHALHAFGPIYLARLASP